jgi:RNA polymerase sigma factor (sigma-70 family)
MNAPRDTILGAACGAIDLAGAAGLSDGQLLERFATRREDVAFEVLLQRHGPMVLGVCRRILGDRHEADDAFQATFLVLVRKAASIAKQQSVGSWLFGVAYRIAIKTKVRARRRRTREGRVMNRQPAEPLDEILWRDLRPVLDEEIDRLPEKYRAPVVLCYLEGKPYAEAARQLGCAKGTIALRLEQARGRLRDRLDRRGVVLSVGMLPALLTPRRAVVPVPAALGEATAKAAPLWATGGESTTLAVSTPVATLAEAALSALAWAKLKVAVTVVLATIVVCGGAGVIVHRVLAESRAATEDGPAVSKKGRKTLADRLEGLPPQR